MTGFEVCGTSYYYEKGRPVLNGFSMACAEGSVNAIMGSNGCGKTTAIKIMAGMMRPMDGKVMFDGKDIHSLSDRERSAYIAYVKQHSNHISDYSVDDYLLFSSVNTLGPFEEPGKEEHDRVEECLHRLGITELASKRVGQLSGGQRQLVNICAALVQDSKVILLDEPTSALDMINENLVLKQLRKMASDTGKTIIFSTHDPNHALYLDANVFLMKDGKVIDSGPSRTIVDKHHLRPVYGDGLCYSDELDYREVSYR